MASHMPLINKPPPPSEPEKQTQKAILKRIVDPSGTLVRYLQNRSWLHFQRSSPWLQPTMAGALQLLPPEAYPDCPAASLTTRFVHVSLNRTRCSLNCLTFTPDGRRCLVGDNIGTYSLWNSHDFNFVQQYQVHDKGVRDVKFTHNGNFMFSGDDIGVVRVVSRNLAPLSKINAHTQPVRAVTIAPTDVKFVTCSDDQSIKLWDLATCELEATLTGHGGEVRCVDWHPTTSLLASCSRDSTVKLWDARKPAAESMLVTLKGHKQPVTRVSWNLNGNWLASAGRDQAVCVWDVRHTKRELVNWKGHTRDILALAWHPIHLELLASGAGANDGQIIFWMVGQPNSVAKIENAHESPINGLAFHPMGHLLASCSGEATTKFWARPRPGDPWRDALQKEEEAGSTSYADLLAALPAQAQAQAGGAGGAGGGAAMATLPGGIAVQLPGRSGGGGGIAGVPRELGAVRIPGIAPPRPPPGGPTPAAAAATAAGGGGVPGLLPTMLPLPPGVMPPGMPGLPGAGAAGAGGLPGLLPGLLPNPPRPPPAGPGRGAGGGRGMGRGGMGRGQPGAYQQQHAGMKRQREGAGGFEQQGGSSRGPPAWRGGGGQPPQPPQQQQQFYQQQQQQQHGGHPQQQQQQQQQRPPYGGGRFGGDGGGGRAMRPGGRDAGGRGGRGPGPGRGGYGGGFGRGQGRR